MFCAYCGVDHDDTTPFSNEHIIPYAIGGANAFSIPVCQSLNNRWGGEIDRQIIEHSLIRSERFFLGLEGSDGTKPTLDLSGEVKWMERRVPSSTLFVSVRRVPLAIVSDLG